MLFSCNLKNTNSLSSKLRFWSQFSTSISSLKVVWKKDPNLDQAIQNDKQWRLCARVVREVINEPCHVIPLRYLQKRRGRLNLQVNIKTFLSQNPGLFDIYLDRIKPKTQLVPFVRPSYRLQQFLDEEKKIYRDNEKLIVSKLCKLLMMSTNKVISADKLIHVKRDFGFPNDFMVNLVPKYPEYFRLVGSPGEGKSFLELASWNSQFAKSAIEIRAEEEERSTGIRVRPNFNVKLPKGFFLKKEMREWTRDWIELPYVSPYEDVSGLEEKSREMEKRMVGVFHELLYLSLYKRVPVANLGKFCEDYRFSNAFSSVFTRHSGIFYMSLKGGIETAMLREAYDRDELAERDPLLEINEKFVALLAEGHKERAEKVRWHKETIQREMQLMASKNSERDLDN